MARVATRRALLSRPAASGPPQYAISFNGTTTRVNCGSDASLDDLHDAAMTVEAWIRADGWGGGNYGYIVSKNNSDMTVGWIFYVGGLGLYCRIYCATTNGYTNADGVVIADSTYHHVAFTWDYATYDYPRLWIDGTEQSNTTQNRVGIVLSNAAKDLYIGNREDNARTFDGDIDWVRISNNIRYSGAFTPPSRSSPPAADANTVEQWNMNDGSGTNVSALVSSPTNDGTLSNGSWVAL